MNLLLNSLFSSLLIATAPANQKPSFDCAKAQSSAEKMVCQNAELAALDREVARLYHLALTGPHINPERKKELTAMQIGWIKGRDDCWKASNKKQCIIDHYVIRAHELRQAYFDARSQDNKGITVGPFALKCKGINAEISLSYINSHPGYAYLTWLNEHSLVLKQAPSGSGARYSAKLDDGQYEFWTKGNQASLTTPGKSAVSCKLEPTG